MLTKKDLQEIQLLLTGTVSPLKKSLDRVEKRVEATEKGVKVLDKRMGTMEDTIKGQNGRIDQIGGVVGQLVEKVYDMSGTIEEIKDKINLLPTKDEYFDSKEWLGGIKGQLKEN